MHAARDGSPKPGCTPHPDWLYLARPRCLRAAMIETTKTIDRMLRRLELDDMDAAARVLRTAFDRALPWLAGLHTPEEDRWFFRERVFKACEVWGAFDSTGLTGVIAFRDGWIDQLYVLPKASRHGATPPSPPKSANSTSSRARHRQRPRAVDKVGITLLCSATSEALIRRRTSRACRSSWGRSM